MDTTDLNIKSPIFGNCTATHGFRKKFCIIVNSELLDIHSSKPMIDILMINFLWKDVGLKNTGKAT